MLKILSQGIHFTSRLVSLGLICELHKLAVQITCSKIEIKYLYFPQMDCVKYTDLI